MRSEGTPHRAVEDLRIGGEIVTETRFDRAVEPVMRARQADPEFAWQAAKR